MRTEKVWPETHGNWKSDKDHIFVRQVFIIEIIGRSKRSISVVIENVFETLVRKSIEKLSIMYWTILSRSFLWLWHVNFGFYFFEFWNDLRLKFEFDSRFSSCLIISDPTILLNISFDDGNRRTRRIQTNGR